MWQRFRSFLSQSLSRFIASLNPLHDREPKNDSLSFTTLAERQKLTDGRLPPPTIDPHTPRRTPAQERRQIEDRPIP